MCWTSYKKLIRLSWQLALPTHTLSVWLSRFSKFALGFDVMQMIYTIHCIIESNSCGAVLLILVSTEYAQHFSSIMKFYANTTLNSSGYHALRCNFKWIYVCGVPIERQTHLSTYVGVYLRHDKWEWLFPFGFSIEKIEANYVMGSYLWICTS